MCAVFAAKIAAGTDHSILSAANLIASQYQSIYADLNLAGDIAAAVEQITSFLTSVFPPNTLIGNCTQLQFCIKKYYRNGSKKRKKLFGGTFFNAEKTELSEKVKTCVSNIAAYHLRVIDGTLPITPIGWTL